MVDHRYNKNPSDWREIFGENDALLYSLAHIFYSASVFMIRGESFRGKQLENYTLRAERFAVAMQDNPLNHQPYLSSQSEPLIFMIGSFRLTQIGEFRSTRTARVSG